MENGTLPPIAYTFWGAFFRSRPVTGADSAAGAAVLLATECFIKASPPPTVELGPLGCVWARLPPAVLRYSFWRTRSCIEPGPRSFQHRSRVRIIGTTRTARAE